jgi:ubiquinone/menaquinone biosynthesis C-methylase UbiE
MLTPAKRIYVEELLDAGAGSDDDVAASLTDLRRINRFGGSRVVLRALDRLVKDNRLADRRLSLLDVGAGSADIPNAVVKWCGALGIESFVVATDLSERNLRVARRRLGISPDIALARADGLALPFPSKSFDVVTASLMLHHFLDDDVTRLLREFARVATRAVIVNDLVRNLIPYYFIRIAGSMLATSFLTRNDGPVSVLRGFTADEMNLLAKRAGLTSFRVERLFPYRLLLVAEVSQTS